MNIEYIKCHHGVEKRFGCQQCIQEKQNTLNHIRNPKRDNRIAIKRGCNANGGCFCDGSCNEIIGYRDPFPGERI